MFKAGDALGEIEKNINFPKEIESWQIGVRAMWNCHQC